MDAIEVWAKRLGGGKVAMLVVNTGAHDTLDNIAVHLDSVGAACGASGCNVRDVWRKSNRPKVQSGSNSLPIGTLGPHASAFLVVAPAASVQSGGVTPR